MKKKLLSRDNDISTETRHSQTDSVNAPHAFSTVPEVAGVDWHTNAKVVQRMIDHPKLKSKIQGHLTVNEMIDQADDSTNFLGYTNDN